MAKKRCPRCSSFNIKKKGFTRSCPNTGREFTARKLQRFLCKECNKSFTFEIEGKHKRYMEDNTTLRSVSNSIGVSQPGLLNWIMEHGKNCKGPLEAALELKLTWFGILGVADLNGIGVPELCLLA